MKLNKMIMRVCNNGSSGSTLAIRAKTTAVCQNIEF
jgi:hypothetical protein